MGEKQLIQVFTFSDDLKRTPAALPPETLWTVLHSGDPLVQTCQLSENEVCGLVAEMNTDSRGEVLYVDHVKRAVQMVFELRRNQLLNAYLQDNAFATLEIPTPNLRDLERLFPLLTPEMKKKREPEKKEEPPDEPMVRRSSRRSSTISGLPGGGRLSSKEGTGRMPTKQGTIEFGTGYCFQRSHQAWTYSNGWVQRSTSWT